MAAERAAQTVWEGDLARGAGKLSLNSSGAAGQLPVTWAARTVDAEGKTSPEELLAGAHASCFSMQLSHELAQSGHPPERLEVGATVTFEEAEGGFRVGSSRLVVRGRVPGLDPAGFERAVRSAGENCPISGAIKGNVDISVDARLER